MTEYLSVSSSIAGLIDLGTLIYGQLDEFIGDARSAHKDTQNLARELQEICLILGRLERAFGDGEHNDGPYSDLRVVLGSCMTKFSQLGVLVQAYRVKQSDGKFLQQWKYWRWTFREKEVAAIRDQLEAHKRTLNIALAFSTL